METLVLSLLYFEAVDAVAKAPVSLCSSSGRAFECFVNNDTSPSSTTSCEASFESREIAMDNEFVISQSCFDAGILDTLRCFPPTSIPSSISSLMFTNIVSGIIDQTPGLDICKSPERCASATSLGKILVRRCSANTCCPVLNKRPSAPLSTLSRLEIIS